MPAALVNLISYYMVGIPLAYGLAFKSEAFQFSEDFTKETSGQVGFWYGMTCALFFHFMGYLIIVSGCGARNRWQKSMEYSLGRLQQPSEEPQSGQTPANFREIQSPN